MTQPSAAAIRAAKRISPLVIVSPEPHCIAKVIDAEFRDVVEACRNTLAKLNARPDEDHVFDRDRQELSAALAKIEAQP